MVKRIASKSELFLGRKIEQLRTTKKVTRKELARKINKMEQEVTKYEAGGFVSLPILENIALALGEQIQKRLIRRISALRHREELTEAEEQELLDLYDEALSIDDDYLED